jgi:hypothetical protein
VQAVEADAGAATFKLTTLLSILRVVVGPATVALIPLPAAMLAALRNPR